MRRIFILSLFVALVHSIRPKRQAPPIPPASISIGAPSSSPPASSSSPPSTLGSSSSDPSSSQPSASSALPVSSPPPPTSPTSPTSTPDQSASNPPSQPTNTTLVVVTTPPSTSSTDSATTTTSPDSASKSPPVNQGTIIGLSVAGGIAVLGIVAFIIWKLTRKRFSEFDADGEEIKWPELNNETHALPTNPTGRVGIDDDGYDEVATGHPRGPSPYGPGASLAGASMADVNPSYDDPYAVPPLPHLNPSQPYRDDPAGAGHYYDPYRGPVPQSLHDPHDGAESIPMSTYTTSSGSATNNNQSYYSGTQSPDQGRRSPGPALSYGRQSPGPAIGYGGRQSPGPHAAYGGRQSPGVATAYGEPGYKQ